VHHAQLVGDDAFAAEVLYQQVVATIRRGTLASLELWLAGFPAATLEQHALLALAAGWLDLTCGRHAGVEHWLEMLESLTYEGPLPDGTSSLAVAVAALRMTSGIGGVKQTAESARTVKEAGPEASPWWGLAWLMEATARYAAGEIDDPVEAYEVAEVGSRGFPAAHVVAVAHLALVSFWHDDGARGQALARAAADELREQGLDSYGMLGMVHCVDAYAAARRGSAADAVSATRRAESLLSLMNDVVPRGLVQQRLVLAESAMLLADHAAARHHLELAEHLLPAEPDALLLHNWANQLGDQLEKLVSRQDQLRTFGITTAELRVLEQLATHRSFDEIGRQLYISRNTVKTHAISIYRRLGVSGRSAAIDKAVEAGVIEG
jgi:LuxR family maltose regulon positive regulatory protein